MERVNIQSDCKTMSKKRTDSFLYLQAVGKYKKVESVNTQNDFEMHKKWIDKKKTNLFCVFCKSL